MIVVDLRRTKSIGPVVVVVDRVIDLLAGGRPTSIVHRTLSAVVEYASERPIRAVSVVLLATVAAGFVLQMALGPFGDVGVIVTTVVAGFAALGLRNETSWERLRETRSIRLLVAALEPPEPSEPFDGTGERTADSEDSPQSSDE